jgi:hypothetical protein
MLALKVTHVAASGMSVLVIFTDTRLMGNYIYQKIHGHIVVNIAGRPCVLDTGAPFSLGFYPITIAGREFPVHESYLDVTCEYLSREIGTTVEGLIGADIVRAFTLGIYPNEQMVQFQTTPAFGNIVLPIDNHMGVPIIKLDVNGKIISAFFDTGAPMSYLLPEALEGLQPECTHEDFYPLVGNFLTPVYRLPYSIGGEVGEMRFGRLPDELGGMLECGEVQGIIGTELLKRFGLSLSISEYVMKLDLPYSEPPARLLRVG